MPQYQDLTIFSIDDDAVPLAGYGTVVGGVITEATFSTDPAHPRPYLKFVEDIGDSTIDFLAGGSAIGQVTLEVLDKRRTAADQTTGVFTYIAAAASGDSALLGVRAVLRQLKLDGVTWETIFDGVIDGISLARLVTYKIVLRDQRERERKLKLFTLASDTCVFPQVGPKEGLGFPTQYDAVAANRRTRINAPVMARIKGVKVGYRELETLGDGSVIGTCSTGSYPPDGNIWVNSQEFEDILTNYGQAIAIGQDSGQIVQRFENVLLEWSATGAAGSYKVIGPMFVAGNVAGISTLGKATNVFSIGDGRAEGREGRFVQFIVFNVTAAEIAAGKKPANGATIYLRVVSNTPPTEEVPLYLEEELGTTLKRAYDGEFTTVGTMTPVRYDAAKMAALIQDTEVSVARITAPVDDGRQWLQDNIYKVAGYAPAIRGGVVYPVKYEVPDASVALVQLDNSNTSRAEWGHGPENVINQVIVEYEREIVQTTFSATGKPVTQKVVFERNRLTDNSQYRHGTKPYNLKPVTLRSIISQASAGPRRPQKELGQKVFEKRAEEILRRYTNGAQVVNATCSRTVDVDALQEGDWVILAVTWLPDYVTRVRGINRLMQIIRIGRSKPHQREFVLSDAGPYDQPIAQPTVGVVVENADGTVSIPITALVAGARAEVQFALGETQPATSSGEWVTAGFLSAVGSVKVPAEVWPGSLLWYRARGTKDGARASAWTNPGSLRLGAQSQVRTFDLSMNVVSTDADYGKPLVRWENLTGTGGVRVKYELHAKGTNPPIVLTQQVDFDATLENGYIPVALTQYQQVTAQVVAYPGFAAGAVTGSAGAATVYRTVQRQEPTFVAPTVAEELSRSSTTATLVLTITDPQKRVTQVKFRTRSGSGGSWSAFAVDGTIPYGTTVTMVPGESSAIGYEVYGYDQNGAEVLLAAASVEFPYNADAGIMRCVARLTAASATTETFTVESIAPDGTRGDVTLVALTGTATLNSGPAVGTPSADGGTGVVWVLNRGAAEGADGGAQFRASKSPYLSDDDTVVVPAQGRDTVAMRLETTYLAITADYVQVRTTLYDPLGGSGFDLEIINTASIDHAEYWTGAAWSTTGDTTFSGLASGASKDFRLYRKTYGSGIGRVTFRVSDSGGARVSDSDSVDIISKDAANALRLRAEKVSGADNVNNEYYKVYAIDPVPQGLNSITLTAVATGCTVNGPSGITGAGVGSGTPTADFSTTGYITLEVARPASTADPGNVSIKATATNRLMGSVDVHIAPKVATGADVTAVVTSLYFVSDSAAADTVTMGWVYTGSIGSGDMQLMRITTVGTTPDLSQSPTQVGLTSGSSPRTMTDTPGEDIISTAGPKITYSYQVRVRDSGGTVLRSTEWVSVIETYAP